MDSGHCGYAVSEPIHCTSQRFSRMRGVGLPQQALLATCASPVSEPKPLRIPKKHLDGVWCGPHTYLVCGCQSNGLDGLAHPHLIRYEYAATVGHAPPHSLPLEGQQGAFQWPRYRAQPILNLLCLHGRCGWLPASIQKYVNTRGLSTLSISTLSMSQVQDTSGPSSRSH